MNFTHSSLDKQTTATQEFDTEEVNCYGNILYGNVNMKCEGFQDEEDRKEDKYVYL